ncbi:MAG: amidohydrolase [Bacteroidetes bacterium]|nr:MAG: amidohydrolase [Bacteroidota bacterium]
MAYHKYKADKIFTGITMLNGDKVLICKTNGEIEAIVNDNEAGDDIRNFNGIISPGLVNAHCHLELSYLKGVIPEKTGMIDFLLGVIKRRNFDEELRLQAIETADNEMLRSGIVAVGDICNGSDTVRQKSRSEIIYRNFIEAAGFPESVAESRLSNAIKVAEIFRSELGNSALVDIVPHAPYSVSGKLMDLINDLGADYVSIHNQETEDENEFLQSKSGSFLRLYEELGSDMSSFIPTGVSSLQSFLPHFSGKRSMMMVHNIASSQDDIDFSKKYQAVDFGNMYWCFCPNANQYINGTIPDVRMFERNNCNIVLGTDSLASNHQLDLVNEIRTLRKFYPELNIANVLRWCTMNGARALGLEEQLGSLDKGKQPGVVVIDGDLGNIKRLI